MIRTAIIKPVTGAMIIIVIPIPVIIITGRSIIIRTVAVITAPVVIIVIVRSRGSRGNAARPLRTAVYLAACVWLPDFACRPVSLGKS